MSTEDEKPDIMEECLKLAPEPYKSIIQRRQQEGWFGTVLNDFQKRYTLTEDQLDTVTIAAFRVACDPDALESMKDFLIAEADLSYELAVKIQRDVTRDIIIPIKDEGDRLVGMQDPAPRPSEKGTMSSQLEKEIQLLDAYEKDYEEHLHESGTAERMRQRYSKQIELVRSQFPEDRAWRFHQANLFHHTAIQKYGEEKTREALEFVDKAISTDGRARHRMLKAKLCHKCGQREAALAELNYICTSFSDSPLYLDARKLKDEIESAPKGGCFIATAAYGSALASEVVFLSRFRDEVLLTSRLGALFVTFYYQVSPPLAFLISRVEFLRAATRCLFLLPLLRLLKRNWGRSNSSSSYDRIVPYLALSERPRP